MHILSKILAMQTIIMVPILSDILVVYCNLCCISLFQALR